MFCRVENKRFGTVAIANSRRRPVRIGKIVAVAEIVEIATIHVGFCHISLRTQSIALTRVTQRTYQLYTESKRF